MLVPLIRNALYFDRHPLVQPLDLMPNSRFTSVSCNFGTAAKGRLVGTDRGGGRGVGGGRAGIPGCPVRTP